MDTRMALGLRSACTCTGHPSRLGCADGCSLLRTDGAAADEELCCLKTKWRPGAVGMFANCMLSIGIVFLLVQCASANEEETTYDASGSPSLPSSPTVPAGSASPLADIPSLTTHSDAEAVSQGGGLRGQPAFSSFLTFLAETAKHPLSLVQSRTSPTITRDKNYTSQRPSDDPDQASDTSSLSFFSSETYGARHVTTGTFRKPGLTPPKDNKSSGTLPSRSASDDAPSVEPTETTSQVSPLTALQDVTTTTASARPSTTTSAVSATRTRTDTTTMSSATLLTITPHRPTTMTTTTTTTTTTTASVPQFSATTRRTTATVTPRTPFTRRNFTPHIPRTASPRAVSTYSPFTTLSFTTTTTTITEAPPQQCNITEKMWVKTVVSIYVRRNRLDSIQRQNLRRGLSQGLRKALNDSMAQAQVETVFGSPNMTVAYHVTGEGTVYTPSVVLEGLGSYGRDRLIADLRQYLPMVTALPIPTALWRPTSATGFQLQTVLRFVGTGDNPRSCRFSQMMEQRLENAFSEAQAKLLGSHSKLSVQMLSVSQVSRSPAVSLVYSVRNGSVFLNGTTASNLLGCLTAELVGYYLFYPPLIIAEPLEYHNLNSSIATRDFWVITVIHDVDDVSLDGHYRSFASLMERRLAELFVAASQQGPRFRRATTVDSYTVQMVSIRRLAGLKSPAEMTYYVQRDGVPLAGASAAKVLNTVDSQTMALTLGYFVQLQAEPVVKNPPNNLWILAAVLAPIAVVTLIIIIITAVLCRKNKNDFKADSIGNLNPRAKMAYRRDVGYFHQPVQGFDYAKQHLGRLGADEEIQPVTQDTLMMALPFRDAPLSLPLEKPLRQDSMASKKNHHAGTDTGKRMPTEDGSVIGNESEKQNSSRGLAVQKVPAQHKVTKEERRRRDDSYDSSSGSLQLISIKPTAAQASYSQPASSDHSQDSAIANGEVSLALKQKSDMEHYRNKLRLKAKRKGYYDFASADAGSSSSRKALDQKPRWEKGHERTLGEPGRPLEPSDERGSTFVGQPAYRSRQSINSPSPGGTEIDLLVMRERPRRGIRNSGYDTEPELIEETNVDRLIGPRGYLYGRGVKGHSETSSLSSQPSIDEVRQQMHLLLEEAFSLASGGGHSTSGHHSHHHPNPRHYGPAPPPLPFSDVITSAPGTVGYGRGGLQWAPSYGAELYQGSIPKPPKGTGFTNVRCLPVGIPERESYPPFLLVLIT
ncbi:UPF0606 protein KIAA1549L [Merluccius polli]|uniref:UPF0606 protein KIAA1549L n=1 Tax=Merluccius polli TaxID=89951 RepID=A0AA47MBD9_MERPO|nr:UPF0606 protein KIAA1549L [Merluccius polli]